MELVVKKAAMLLFVTGCIVSVAAFFGDKSSNFPWILKFVAKDYCQASEGLAVLDKSSILTATNVGFIQLAMTFRRLAEKENPKEIVDQVSVERFELGNPFLGFGEKAAGFRHPVKVHLSTGQVIDWDRAKITAEIESIRDQGILRYSVIVFLLGMVVQIVAFILERFADEKSGSTELANKDCNEIPCAAGSGD